MSVGALANGDVLSVRNIFQVNNQANAFNVLHYQIGSLTGTPPNSSTGLSDVAAAVYNFLSPTWAAIASVQATWQITSVTSEWPLPRSVAWNLVPGTPAVGVVAGDALPAQDTITVLKRTLVGDRTGLGRVFLVGFAEGSQLDGKLTAGVVAAVNAHAAKYGQLIVVIGTGYSLTLTPVLWKKTPGPVVSSIVTPIYASQLSNTTFKMQRRRRPGKGI